LLVGLRLLAARSFHFALEAQAEFGVTPGKRLPNIGGSGGKGDCAKNQKSFHDLVRFLLVLRRRGPALPCRKSR